MSKSKQEVEALQQQLFLRFIEQKVDALQRGNGMGEEKMKKTSFLPRLRN